MDLLLSRGHKVVGIDNFVTGSVDNIAHLGGNSNFKFIEQDVTEFIFLDTRVDYVWHFASPASPIDYLELPIQTLKVGSLGTHKALGVPYGTHASRTCGAGVPSVVFGPGSIDQAHTKDEWIDIDDFSNMVAVTKKIIERWCSNEQTLKPKSLQH